MHGSTRWRYNKDCGGVASERVGMVLVPLAILEKMTLTACSILGAILLDSGRLSDMGT